MWCVTRRLTHIFQGYFHCCMRNHAAARLSVKHSWWICRMNKKDQLRTVHTLRPGAPLLKWSKLNPSMDKWLHYKVWDEMTYPSLNFSVAAVEVWESISNFIPHFTGCVISCPCWVKPKGTTDKWYVCPNKLVIIDSGIGSSIVRHDELY